MVDAVFAEGKVTAFFVKMSAEKCAKMDGYYRKLVCFSMASVPPSVLQLSVSDHHISFR